MQKTKRYVTIALVQEGELNETQQELDDKDPPYTSKSGQTHYNKNR